MTTTVRTVVVDGRTYRIPIYVVRIDHPRSGKWRRKHLPQARPKARIPLRRTAVRERARAIAQSVQS